MRTTPAVVRGFLWLSNANRAAGNRTVPNVCHRIGDGPRLSSASIDPCLQRVLSASSTTPEDLSARAAPAAYRYGFSSIWAGREYTSIQVAPYQRDRFIVDELKLSFRHRRS